MIKPSLSSQFFQSGGVASPLRWRHKCEDFRMHLCLIQSQTPSTPLCLHSKKWERAPVWGWRVSVSVCLERACLSQRLPTGIRGMWISEGPPPWYPVVSRLSPPHPSSMHTNTPQLPPPTPHPDTPPLCSRRPPSPPPSLSLVSASSFSTS